MALGTRRNPGPSFLVLALVLHARLKVGPRLAEKAPEAIIPATTLQAMLSLMFRLLRFLLPLRGGDRDTTPQSPDHDAE